MGLFMPGRRAKPRRFSYEPRYYNPEKDDKLRRRLRIHGRARRRRPTGILFLLVLLGFAIYIYTLLQ
jgi:hypothetical protein